jgi:hypothetical protein
MLSLLLQKQNFVYLVFGGFLLVRIRKRKESLRLLILIIRNPPSINRYKKRKSNYTSHPRHSGNHRGT